MGQYKKYKSVFKRYDNKCKVYSIRLRKDNEQDAKLIEMLETAKAVGVTPKDLIKSIVTK